MNDGKIPSELELNRWVLGYFIKGRLSFSYIPSYMYTHVSVLQILLKKYEHRLVVGVVEICTCKQGVFFQQ